jgi:hypothetical protein
MKACPPCADEYISFQETFSMLDTWTAPEPSAYFDQKLAVRLREEQSAPRMGRFEALAFRMRFNTGRSFRPALIGALSLALAVGGGSVFLADQPVQHKPAAVSTTINDLQILDRNEQAFQQLDELQQDADQSSQPAQDAPSGPPPTS